MIYVINDYKNRFCELRGKELSDRCIVECIKMYADDKGIDIKADSVKVIRNESGKPFVYASGANNLYISVSHSENTFACIIEESNVGLDIQFRRKVNYQKLAQRFFSEEEQAYVRNHGEDGFFFIWARKEAFAKYTGRGINDVVSKNNVFDLKNVEFEDSTLEADLFCSVCRGAF